MSTKGVLFRWKNWLWKDYIFKRIYDRAILKGLKVEVYHYPLNTTENRRL